METGAKKEIFIKILRALFNDVTQEINENNCIPFYHFLVDTLELETIGIPADEEEDISLCYALIDLLSNFNQLKVDMSFWNANQIKEYLQDYSGLDDREIEISLYKFRKIYIFIKDDFLLDLP